MLTPATRRERSERQRATQLCKAQDEACGAWSRSPAVDVADGLISTRPGHLTWLPSGELT